MVGAREKGHVFEAMRGSLLGHIVYWLEFVCHFEVNLLLIVAISRDLYVGFDWRGEGKIKVTERWDTLK